MIRCKSDNFLDNFAISFIFAAFSNKLHGWIDKQDLPFLLARILHANLLAYLLCIFAGFETSCIFAYFGRIDAEKSSPPKLQKLLKRYFALSRLSHQPDRPPTWWHGLARNLSRFPPAAAETEERRWKGSLAGRRKASATSDDDWLPENKRKKQVSWSGPEQRI